MRRIAIIFLLALMASAAMWAQGRGRFGRRHGNGPRRGGATASPTATWDLSQHEPWVYGA